MQYDSIRPGQGGGGGEYLVQTGFGWTNGVILEFLNTFPNIKVRRVAYEGDADTEIGE